eukprot:gene13647-15075_t
MEILIPTWIDPWADDCRFADMIPTMLEKKLQPSVPDATDSPFRENVPLLEKLIQMGWHGEPSNRPSAEELLRIINDQASANQEVQNWLHKWQNAEGVTIEITSLRKHQGTVAEIAGELSTHLWLQNRHQVPENLRADIEKSRRKYDGTNAGQFISCVVADYCLDWKPSIRSGEMLKADIEHLFLSVPQKVNSLRDISNFADADEALYILRASGVIKRHYYLDEELQEAQVIASIDDLKSHLHAGISRMGRKRLLW